MKSIITILFLFSCNISSATTYYVSNAGSDGNSGTSTSTPWQTLSKVNSSSLSPGDNVYFLRGNDFRGTLTVPSSGSLGNPITFGAYGTGVKPRILGSELATGWTNMGGNVWEASGTFTNPDVGDGYPGTIYFTTFSDTTFGHVQKSNTFGLAVQYDWCWVSGKISIYSSVDPSILYNQVEVTQRKDGIYLNNKNYLVFDGLDINFTANNGISGGDNIGKKGLLIQNFNVSYIGVKGGGSAFGIQANYSNMTIQDGVVHSTGRRGISIGNILDYDTIKNVKFNRLTMYDGYHTTGFDIACGSFGNVIDSIDISDCYIYDSANKKISGAENYGSNLIYMESFATGGGYIGDITISNCLFGFPSMTAVQISNIIRAKVINCTFKGTNSNLGSEFGGESIGYGDGSTYTTIKNNIFYINTSTATQAYAVDMGSSDPNVAMDYNLYYTVDASRSILRAAAPYSDTWQMADIAAFRTTTGQEAHSVVADPMLNSNFTLQAGSPAIGAGEGGVNMGKIFANPPVVNAGNDTTIIIGNSVTLNGSVTTDSAHTATYLWAFQSGSGTFSNATILNPVVTSIGLGSNVIRLTATQDDTQVAFDEMTITATNSEGASNMITVPKRVTFINKN